MTATQTRTKADPQEIAATLRLFVEPGQVMELRILNTARAGTVSGYFNDLDKAANAAAGWSGQAPAVYFTINPVIPSLLARRSNRLEERAKNTTGDGDIERRRWFFIDFDPKRPAGISSTDQEHQAALTAAAHARDWLSSLGWPMPIEADSSNGAHLHYSIDLPNDRETAGLLQLCLQAMAFQVSTAAVDVDLTTFNASRICKLYGTLSCKGDSTPDRPHRVSRILAAPDQLVKVPRDLLEALAGMQPPEPEKHHSGNGYQAANGFDLEAWIRDHGLPVVNSGPWKSTGKKWVLNPCPWNEAHDNNAAFIIRQPDGAIGAGCRHNGCAGKGWHELRDLYEPGWRDRRNEKAKTRKTAETPGPDATPKPSQEFGTMLSTVQSQLVEWLWQARIPLGKLSIIDGDPGLGKSVLTLDLAARVSRGMEMPDATPGRQGGVVLLSAEDGLEDTIRPRLDAAGADVARILALDRIPDGDGVRLPVLPQDAGIIRLAIQRVGAVLVIIDPLTAYLDGNINSHRDQDIRRALHPLAKVADETGAAVLVVRHLNKGGGGGSPVYRGGGSIGIIGAARSGLLVAKDPDNQDRRVLASTKCNLARLPPSLVYGLDTAPNGALRVGWMGESNHTAETLLAAPRDGEERDGVQEAIEVLRSILENGPVAAAEVKSQARKAGLSERVLGRAKEALGVTARKVGFQGAWNWFMPCQKP